MYALNKGMILTGDGILTDKAIVVDEGKISALVSSSELSPSIHTIDLAGNFISAGFIDLQLNGCGGVMFNTAPSYATLQQMHHTNLRGGTTSFLPTLISDSDEQIRQGLAATQEYMQKHTFQVLGMHLEGPYTNTKRKGIHPIDQLRTPSNQMIQWLSEQALYLKKVTLAPEVNQLEHIRQLANAGITVSLGHSAANYSQAIAGFNSGISFVTHLYNAMTLMENAREPGVLGAVFDRKDIYAGIIADGLHVHWANIRLAKRLLGERLCLVTDATAAALAPPDMQNFDFCGTNIDIHDGLCVDENGTLGGSSLTMIEGVKRLIEHTDIGLEEAFKMATLYPAQAINMDQHIGAIKPGMVANLVIVDHQYQIKNTIVNGHWAA
jgi:N-acetylglucosamine-6-phosphate deacetylase